MMGQELRSTVARVGFVPSRERTRLRLYLILLVLDAVLILALSTLATDVLQRGHGQPLLAAQLMLPIYLTIALHNGAYSMGSLTNWSYAVSRMVAALFIAALLLNFLAFFVKINAMFSRAVFVTGTVSAGLAMAGVRYFLVAKITRLWGLHPVNRLVIDAGGPPVALPHSYRINAIERGLSPSLDNPHQLNRLATYFRNMDEVIVSCPLEQRMAWAHVLKASGVHGEVTSGLAREIGALGVVHHDQAGVSTLLVALGPLGIRGRVTKRLFDILVSAAALVLLAPVLLPAMALVRLQDGGPALFRQQRMGRGNRLFWIYKLRTMRVHAADADGTISARPDDERVTRVGRFLRRTSIDELPQLVNVLLGDMSLVGPRPHALGSQAGNKLFWEVDGRYWLRHSLRPGITGLAQVRGLRGATQTEHDLTSRLQADLEYLAGWSIWRDIRIVLATFRVLVHARAF